MQAARENAVEQKEPVISKRVKNNEYINWNLAKDWLTQLDTHLKDYLDPRKTNRTPSRRHRLHAQRLLKIISDIRKNQENIDNNRDVAQNTTEKEQWMNILLTNLKKPKQLKKWYHNQKSFLYTLSKFAYRQHENHNALAGTLPVIRQLNEQLLLKDQEIARLNAAHQINVDKITELVEQTKELGTVKQRLAEEKEEKKVLQLNQARIVNSLTEVTEENSDLKSKLEQITTFCKEITDDWGQKIRHILGIKETPIVMSQPSLGERVATKPEGNSPIKFFTSHLPTPVSFKKLKPVDKDGETASDFQTPKETKPEDSANTPSKLQSMKDTVNHAADKFTDTLNNIHLPSLPSFGKKG